MRVVEVPLEKDPALDLGGIERAFAAGACALPLCNPQNPNGHVPTFDELNALATLANRHGVWVLVDEILAPLTMPGNRFTPYLSVSEQAAQRGIAPHSASKAFNLAGLKAGLAVTASTPPVGSSFDCRATGLGDDPAEAVLQHGRLALSRRLDFGSPGAGHLRLNFGTTEAVLDEAVHRMKTLASVGAL